MHAATKPQILGLIFVLAGDRALRPQLDRPCCLLAPVLIFQMLTAPISAHMIGRAGYRTGNFDRDHLLADELEEAIDQAQSRDDSAAAGDGRAAPPSESLDSYHA